MLKNEELLKVKHELETQQITLDKQVQMLRFQNKELVQLSEIVAHDLQEPLRKLLLFSTLLLNAQMDESGRLHALNIIKRSSTHIKKLFVALQEYLGFALNTIEVSKVNLAEMVKNECEKLMDAYPQVQVNLQQNILPQIEGDELQLTWLFHHLLNNAFEHGVKDGKLDLTI